MEEEGEIWNLGVLMISKFPIFFSSMICVQYLNI